MAENSLLKMKVKNWLLLEKEDLDQRIRRYPRFRFLLLAAAILGLLVSIFWLWQKTLSPDLIAFDTAVMKWAADRQIPILIIFFSRVTHLGGQTFIAIVFLILVAILVARQRKRAAAAALISLAGSAGLVFFLKQLFARPRPFNCLPDGDCWAFPSGHTTLAFYFYGLLSYLIWRFLPLSLKKSLLIHALIALIIILVALSRLVLGWHYPSDILAGFFLGATWLTLAILLIDILY